MRGIVLLLMLLLAVVLVCGECTVVHGEADSAVAHRPVLKRVLKVLKRPLQRSRSVVRKLFGCS